MQVSITDTNYNVVLFSDIDQAYDYIMAMPDQINTTQFNHALKSKIIFNRVLLQLGKVRIYQKLEGVIFYVQIQQ